jgi:3-oxoacyl-[acyl-carrier protein] reductase
MSCDVSSYEDVKVVVQRLTKDGMKIYGVVNAAGIASMENPTNKPVPSGPTDGVHFTLMSV